MRYSQVHQGETYLSSTVVTVSEASKLLVSLCVLVFLDRRRALSSASYSSIAQSELGDVEVEAPAPGYLVQLLGCRSKFSALLAPAVLYAATNNLQFVAAAHLDAATYQVAYQGKLVTTAVLAVAVLGHKMSHVKWLAIIILTVGMCITVMPARMDKSDGGDMLTGLSAVALGCFFSSLAAILVEGAMKGWSRSSSDGVNLSRNMWLRNCQLSLAGTFVSLVIVGIQDWKEAITHGFFHGYTPMVWLIVLLQTAIGVVVSIVITYADNILKGFATSLSVLVSTVASVAVLDFDITPSFAAGAVLVLLATYQYNIDS